MEQQASSAADDNDEWELCNDDGFIYKRKKRRLAEPLPVPSADTTTVNPEEEEKRRRERKRRTLLRLMEQYKREIEQWEVLSKSLSAMQETAKQLEAREVQRREQREEEQDNKTSVSATVSIDTKEKNACGSLVDELLSQAEAQEAIIRDVSNLCNIAEALCDVQEEQIKQSYMNLPVWASPSELMAALCDE